MSKSFKIIVFSMLTAAVCVCLNIIFRFPYLKNIHYWFWDYTFVHLNSWYIIIFLFIILLLLINILLNKKLKTIYKILIIFILGIVLEFGFGFSEGNGLDAFARRNDQSGHSEYAKLAFSHKDMFYVLSNYENLLKTGELGKFPNSKPPGTMMFYIGMRNISDYLMPSIDSVVRHKSLILFLSLVFPFLTFSTVFPLYGLSKKFLKEQDVILPSLLFILTPAVLLINMHLDQVLYPLLFVSSLYLIYESAEKKSALLSISAGLLISLSLFFSFSLLPLIPLTFFIYLKSILNSSDKKRDISNVYLMILTVVILHLVLYIVANYNVILRCHNALEYHQTWKLWTTSFKHIVYFGFINLFEFSYGLGVALAIFLVSIYIRNFKEIFTKNEKIIGLNDRISQLLSLKNITLLIIIYLAFFSKTMGETARLWIFMIPLILIVIVNELDKYNLKEKKFLIYIMIILEFISVSIMKFGMDFHHFD